MIQIRAVETAESMVMENGNFMTPIGILNFFSSLSDIMDLRHQSSAMCIIMLGGEDTHPWSATREWSRLNEARYSIGTRMSRDNPKNVHRSGIM